MQYRARTGFACSNRNAILKSPLEEGEDPHKKMNILQVSTTTNQNERTLHVLAPKGPAADVARMTR